MKNIDSELQFLRAKAGHSSDVEDRIGAVVSEMIRRSRLALRALLGEPDSVPVPAFQDLKVPRGKMDPRGGFVDSGDGRPGGHSIAQREVRHLALSSGVRIKPNASATITARSQDLFRPHRMIIGGEPNRWVVNDIKIGRRSQFAANGDIPGYAFSASAPIVPMDVVPTCGSLNVTVTYIGSVEEGEEFLCVALGEYGSGAICVDADAIDNAATWASWAYLPIWSGHEAKISGSSHIVARPEEPFLTKKIVICGEPSRWVVEDILVGNRSQLANKGDIPGEAFSLLGSDLRLYLALDTIQTAMDFKLCVRYVGPVAGGEPFSAYAIGPIASLS